MNLEEANLVLNSAPDDGLPSRVNPFLTRADVVRIIRRGLGPRCIGPDGQLIPLYEKRVLQVSQDRKRPQPFPAAEPLKAPSAAGGPLPTVSRQDSAAAQLRAESRDAALKNWQENDEHNVT
jgi:hypothetical protein